MNLAYRDVRHNLFRFLLTCLGLSLLMAVVLSIIGIYNGLVIDALTIVRASAVDVWVVESLRAAVWLAVSAVAFRTIGRD
jgi:putative ABC transport system permease protein